MGRFSSTPYLISPRFDGTFVAVSAVCLSGTHVDLGAVRERVRVASVEDGQVTIEVRGNEWIVVNLGDDLRRARLGRHRLDEPVKFARISPTDRFTFPHVTSR